MATPNPPLTVEQRLAMEQKQKYDNMLRNVAIGGAILCPTLIIMPPRKLDLYTFALGIGFYLSTDHLLEHYTGRDLFHQVSFTRPNIALPTEKARETQRMFQEQRLREGQERLQREGRVAEEKNENKGVFQRLWMGEETEGWKERRLEEEKKALEEGKTYTSMIMEQVWEVWNWDKKKNGEGKEGASERSEDEPKKS
jgi:hypothetical protein